MTDPNHRRILDKVDASREQAIGFLQKMIAIPSVTGDEAAIQRFVSNHMKEIGLKVDLWETDWEALKKHPGYRPVAAGVDLVKDFLMVGFGHCAAFLAARRVDQSDFKRGMISRAIVSI